jgi:hypothetical protein
MVNTKIFLLEISVDLVNENGVVYVNKVKSSFLIPVLITFFPRAAHLLRWIQDSVHTELLPLFFTTSPAWSTDE